MGSGFSKLMLLVSLCGALYWKVQLTRLVENQKVGHRVLNGLLGQQGIQT